MGLPNCTCSSHCLQVEGCQCERGKAKQRIAQAEAAVVEAAMEYERVRVHTQDASEWNAVKLMLREACAALAKARGEA